MDFRVRFQSVPFTYWPLNILTFIHHPYILLSFIHSQSFRIPSRKTCFCYRPMCIPHCLLNDSLSSPTFYPTVIRTFLRAVSLFLVFLLEFQKLILPFIKKVRNYAGNRMGNRAWNCWLRCSYLVARDGPSCPDGSSGSAIEGTFNRATRCWSRRSIYWN